MKLFMGTEAQAGYSRAERREPEGFNRVTLFFYSYGDLFIALLTYIDNLCIILLKYIDYLYKRKICG